MPPKIVPSADCCLCDKLFTAGDKRTIRFKITTHYRIQHGVNPKDITFNEISISSHNGGATVLSDSGLRINTRNLAKQTLSPEVRLQAELMGIPR
jgi:hypothetical protein